MKYVFLLTQSLESPSGLGRYWPIAKQMARLGHSIEMLALHPDWENLAEKRFVRDGVQVHYVAQMHVRKQGSGKTYFSPLQFWWVSLVATLRLTAALWKSEAQVVQICKAQPFNILAARLARRGRPIFVDCDDYEAETNLFTSGLQKAIVRYFEDSIIRFAQGISVNTKFLAQRLVALDYPSHQIVYTPNGVDPERFAVSSQVDALRQKLGLGLENPIIVYVGTLGLASHPVDLLIEAMPLVQQHCPMVKLLLVGGGEDLALLQQSVRKLGLQEQVVFAGRVAPEEIPAYYRLGTVSVDPVRDDLVARARSPLKVVESLACGVPVITSPVGDRPEMLGSPAAGLLVTAGSPQALAEGILKILNNPALQEDLAQLAQQAAGAWSWEQLAPQFIRVYKQIGLAA